MEKNDILQHLINILNTKPLTTEEKIALAEVIELLKKAKTKEEVMDIIKLLLTLLGIGSKFF